MRSPKELINLSKEFVNESKLRSWTEVMLTLALVAGCLTIALTTALPLSIRLCSSFVCGLLYVRTFVIYHDYQHRAILKNSGLAEALMTLVGIYLLAPKTIWIRSHEHHHNNNSKLTMSGIGSYPTIEASRYQHLTKHQRLVYLINRHPLTIIFGYLTLFIYWLNLKSLFQSPGRHLDSLLALLFHFAAGFAIWHYMGATSFLIGWVFPFFMAFGIGSYLFYCQHNFPEAKFKENHDWTYVNAAITSTSFMVMDPVMNWFTGYIGYHHIHHVNSRIPFYRLKEAFLKMPELKNVGKTSWNPMDVIRCFQLKLWDAARDKMITMREFKQAYK